MIHIHYAMRKGRMLPLCYVTINGNSGVKPSSGYGGVICPAAWQAAQLGRTSTFLETPRPNSGTHPTRQETRQEMAFQRHSGAAGPPLHGCAVVAVGGSPSSRRTVRQDRPSGRPTTNGPN